MIRCNYCRRLYPKGTLYCGRCGGSLGCRFCNEGHENPLQMNYCLTCGSKKLSFGVPATNFRPWLVAVGSILIFGTAAWCISALVEAASSIHPRTPSIEAGVQLVVLVTLAALFLGGRAGRKAVLKFYGGLFKFLMRALIEVIKSLIPSGGSHH